MNSSGKGLIIQETSFLHAIINYYLSTVSKKLRSYRFQNENADNTRLHINNLNNDCLTAYL